MELTAWAAGWFLLAAVPISGFVIFSDLSRMKIPNLAVGALVAAYAVLGLIALPFEMYLWQWTHLVVLLIVGIVLNAPHRARLPYSQSCAPLGELDRRTALSVQGMQLPLSMMRDILIKTMFRMNIDQVRELSTIVCLPIPVVQELIDMARSQLLLEAMGTLNANNGSEMGYQLTDAGKARALDALAQSEYFGAMPVPLEIYREQVKRQSIRNITMTRDRLVSAMGHLVLPDTLLDHLGPAVGAGRSILMYGPPGNGKSSISNGVRDALGDKIYIPRAIEYSGQVITVYDPIVHSAAEADVDDRADVSSPVADEVVRRHLYRGRFGPSGRTATGVDQPVDCSA